MQWCSRGKDQALEMAWKVGRGRGGGQQTNKRAGNLTFFAFMLKIMLLIKRLP